MSTADGFPTTLVIPTGFTKFTAATDPISASVKSANPGDLIELGPGNFRRCGPFTSPRLLGMPPVTIKGQGNSTTITRDVNVGSTDAIYLGPLDHDTAWRDLWIQADDRAGIKTVTGVGPNHSFDNITVYGFGWPCDPAGWKDDSKWGIHGYDTAGWIERNVNVWSIFQEHCHYFHNIKGDHLFDGISCAYAGRTAFQFVNRMTEGAAGKGDITIKNAGISDVCLEQGGGGSAITFAGGMPDTNILLDNVNVFLGCNAQLQAPFNQNITGALVVSNPQESAPGKGDGAWPGGIKMLVWQNSVVEIGTIYSGQGSALRSAIKLDCPSSGYFFNHLSVKVTRGSGQIAVVLEVTEQAGPLHIDPNTVTMVGAVNYKGSKYQTFDSFKAAHPECFV